MSTLRQKRTEEDIKEVIGKAKLSDAISEDRMIIISGYARLPGGPIGVRIANEKAFKELQDSLSSRPLVQDMLEQLKVLAVEYGEVPLNWLISQIKENKTEITASHKWLIRSGKKSKVSETTVKTFCSECKRKGILTVEYFVPKNKAELNFFIGEAAYFSRVYRTYHIRPVVPKEFFNLLAYSSNPEHVQALHHWYDKEGKNLAKIGFSGEQRALLLGCGLTKEWIDRLTLSKEDALFLAERYPTCWREFDVLKDITGKRAEGQSK